MLPAGVDAQKTDKAMTVFVTATEVVDVTKVDKETQKRLEAAIKDAEKKRKDLDAQGAAWQQAGELAAGSARRLLRRGGG